jgi:hypothetical protein
MSGFIEGYLKNLRIARVSESDIRKKKEELYLLRDIYAGLAMQGMFTTAAAPCLNGLDGHEELTAISAFKMADAMLKARES